MKILHILISRGWNAQTANACLIIDQQIEQGHHLTVLAIANSKVSREQEKKGKSITPNYEHLPDYHYFRHKRSPSLAFKLARMLKENQVEIIHIHGANYGRFRTWLAFKLSGKTVPVFFSTRDKPKKKRSNKLLGLGYYKKVLVPNKLVERYYQQLVGANCERELPFEIFPAPVDTRRFKPVPKQTENRPLVIGMFARFDPIKGYPYFFEACQKLLATPDVPECRLVIAGFNFEERRSEIEELIQRYGLKDRTTICDYLPHIEQMISQLDIGVIASVGSEEISRIALEYMSCGIPVVATTVGGITECVSPGEGILVPPRSSQDIYQALLTLVLDEALRGTLGMSGRKRVLNENSVTKLCQKLEQHYQEALHLFKQHQIYWETPTL